MATDESQGLRERVAKIIARSASDVQQASPFYMAIADKILALLATPDSEREEPVAWAPHHPGCEIKFYQGEELLAFKSEDMARKQTDGGCAQPLYTRPDGMRDSLTYDEWQLIVTCSPSGMHELGEAQAISAAQTKLAAALRALYTRPDGMRKALERIAVVKTRDDEGRPQSCAWCSAHDPDDHLDHGEDCPTRIATTVLQAKVQPEKVS